MNKSAMFTVLTFLAFLLTACPTAQVQVVDVNGTWAGLVGDLGSNDSKSPLTADFVQTDTVLGGTATLGPTPGGISDELVGTLEGTTATFEFSFLSEVDDDGDVTTFETTYTFTGEVTDNTLQGGIISVSEGIDSETKGEFELTRE